MGIPLKKYPYTDFHELNLDYILNELNKIKDADTNMSAYIHDIEVSDGVITVKNGAGDVVATIDTIQKAIFTVTGISGSNSGFTVYDGGGNNTFVYYPVRTLFAVIDEYSAFPATMDVGDSSYFNIDTTAHNLYYDNYENMIQDIDKGRSVRIVLADDEFNAKYAVPVYMSNGELYCDMVVYANNTATWKSFALSFESFGVPPTQRLIITRVK
ncbi:MAG: hypothetical protein J6S85_20275 [Methanobrevibacter sp.]|nr:hypothetical protein [Clostridia bacterium]MBO7715912.1 hypothetical protein [Methanobrevibacter sp.]